jgi:hypothetical protein
MVTTTEPKPEATTVPGGGGGNEGQLAIEIEHQVLKLENDAKNEGVPIVGHVLEGMDNIGDSGGGALDPLAQLFSSGLGWMIDSVGFLRDPIEKLDGDAAAVQTAVDSMKHVTENLTYVAQAHQEDIPTLQDWEGDAGEAYRTSMKLLREEIISLARVVEGLGTLAAVSGSMVLTLRKIVRDLVTASIASIIIIMGAALAAAFVTFGASIAIGVGASIAAAMAVMVESTRRITMLMSALGRQTERMGELETIAEDVADGLTRFEKSIGLSPTEPNDPAKQWDQQAPEYEQDSRRGTSPDDPDMDSEPPLTRRTSGSGGEDTP